MFGKKANEIANLKAIIKSDNDLIESLVAANESCQQKLVNAQALVQRAEADRDAQKKRADENYTQRCDQEKRADDWYDKYLAEKKRADSLVVPFTAAAQAEADGFEPPKPAAGQKPRATKPKKG